MYTPMCSNPAYTFYLLPKRRLAGLSFLLSWYFFYPPFFIQPLVIVFDDLRVGLVTLSCCVKEQAVVFPLKLRFFHVAAGWCFSEEIWVVA